MTTSGVRWNIRNAFRRAPTLAADDDFGVHRPPAREGCIRIVLRARPARARMRQPDPREGAAVADLPFSASVGQPAPDFTLPSAPDATVTLSRLRGRPVVLVFYPADWSPVCSDQVALYNEMLPVFRDYDAEILGLSVDGVWCHAAFAANRKLHFPLLADFEPKGEIARRFGVYDAKSGIAERALFVIDAGGIVRWRYVSPIDINPGADGILEALDRLHERRES
jgi:peroxiredoxin